ncbi:leukemia NUP98 fusion partner 1 isoform X2 [Stigmatopora nigra]
MSLRLLPAIVLDDEDNDGNFTKWMSSYWGHGTEGRGATAPSRERKRSFRRPTNGKADRRASLPSVSQLDAMKLNQLHEAVTPVSHVKNRDDKAEIRPHQRARRCSSDDNGRTKSAIPENRIGTIPELSEFFQKRLCLQDKRKLSINDDAKLCLLCHDNMCPSGGAVQQLHCVHAFHKECAERWIEKKQACPMCRIMMCMPKLVFWSSSRLKVP